MIVAEFFRKNGEITGFKVSGHAEYDESGRDIVCAGVSSAVMMTANLITEIFRFEAEVSAVSYTHLDVYKRQAEAAAIISPSDITLRINDFVRMDSLIGRGLSFITSLV